MKIAVYKNNDSLESYKDLFNRMIHQDKVGLLKGLRTDNEVVLEIYLFDRTNVSEWILANLTAGFKAIYVFNINLTTIYRP